MVLKKMKTLTILIILIIFTIPGFSQAISFEDDFEKGPGKWDFVNGDKIEILDSHDAQHKNVLCLHSGGEAVYALIKNSHGWTNYKIEGDVRFPDPTYYHYMGLIYNYNVRGRRTDFGSIFLLGPFGDTYDNYWKNFRPYLDNPPDEFLGNIILVNPHRDSNASRCLYSEYWVVLKDDNDTVKPGEWGHFKAEVLGPVCHFYVGDMETPKVTYDYFEYDSGRVGFKPRFAGSEIWLDNVKVTPIKKLSYKGPIKPDGIIYKPEKLLTQWQVIGPFSKQIKEIETDNFQPDKQYFFNQQEFKWQPFQVDGRGCVVSGSFSNRFDGRHLAYFHTEISSDSQKEVALEFSSANPLIIWINNTPVGEIKAHLSAWYDFVENPEHQGEKVKVTLKPGKNHLLVMSRGARYGGDGFYAYCNMNPPAEKKETKKTE